MPTLNQYIRHAKLYGTDCVFPTAASQRDLSARELVELKLEIRRLAADHRKARKPPSWSDDVPTVNETDVLALHAEGFTPSEIVVHTGLTLKRVEQVTKDAPATTSFKFDRKRPSSDVSGWDAEIMSGEVANQSKVDSGPSVHAGSTSTSVGEEAKLGQSPTLLESAVEWHEKGRTPESRAKRTETFRRKAAQADADILRLRREREMVPGGISRVLGVGEARVRKVLRQAGLL